MKATKHDIDKVKCWRHGRVYNVTQENNLQDWLETRVSGVYKHFIHLKSEVNHSCKFFYLYDFNWTLKRIPVKNSTVIKMADFCTSPFSQKCIIAILNGIKRIKYNFVWVYLCINSAFHWKTSSSLNFIWFVSAVV